MRLSVQATLFSLRAHDFVRLYISINVEHTRIDSALLIMLVLDLSYYSSRASNDVPQARIASPETFRPATFAPQVTESSASCVYTASMLSKHRRYLIFATTPKSPRCRRRKLVCTTEVGCSTTCLTKERRINICSGLLAPANRFWKTRVVPAT